MGRLICAMLWVMIGCSPPGRGVSYTEDGYVIVVADPTEAEASAGADLSAIERRCFDGAHTLIVGPGPGCATATLAERRADPVVCDGSLPLVGAPLRIVRRGTLPVRLELSWPQSWTYWPDELPPGVYRTSTPTSADCCAVHEEGREATGLTPYNLRFDTSAIDDTLELIVVTADADAVVRACALELTEIRARFLGECAEWCATDVACGWTDDEEECLRECDADAGLQNEPCLEARIEGRRCRVSPEPECTRIELGRGEPPCGEHDTRELVECL